MPALTAWHVAQRTPLNTGILNMWGTGLPDTDIKGGQSRLRDLAPN